MCIPSAPVSGWPAWHHPTTWITERPRRPCHTDLNAFKFWFYAARMNTKTWMYVAYLVVSIGLTMWVARTLSRNGLVFLEDALGGERLARSVNHLLVAGFYLLNLGYVAIAMRVDSAVSTTSEAFEQLSWKVGLVLLVLGALHLFNVYALNRYRRTRGRQQAPHPPLPPAGHTPVAPGWSQP